MNMRFRKKFETVNEIIFGWDKFNAITFFIFILLFCVWCFTFFFTYNSNTVQENQSGHQH